MLNPIFAHRLEQHHEVPQSPTNQERMQAYRAIAPVQFANTVFNPHRQSEAAAARGALADGDFYDPDPPTPEEVAEAYQLKYG